MPVPFTFASSGSQAAAPIDMTRTMAPEVRGFREHLVRGLQAVAELPELPNVVQRHRFHGTVHDKEVAAAWLGRRLGSVPDTSRVLLTGGTQNILMILFSRLIPKGSVIATEKLTYAAIGQLAMLAGITVVPIDIDKDGILAESLEQLCKIHKVAAIYTNPTGHNPTTSVMPVERRQKVAEVARRYNISIIEDDVHGFITNDAPAPIASIAPELTWYVMSVSKCLGMGLRAAYLVAPNSDKLTKLSEPIPSISAWFVPGVSAALITSLIETGAADEIAMNIVEEIGMRQEIARDLLGSLELMHTNRSSLHIWVDLPKIWSVEAFIGAAAARGVTLRHPNVFATPGTEVKGNLRLSIVAPVTQTDLREGLARVADLLKSRM